MTMVPDNITVTSKDILAGKTWVCWLLSPCAALGTCPESEQWGNGEKTKTRHGCHGFRCTGLSDRELQHLVSAECLLQSWRGRIIIHSWIKDTGLANLSRNRSSLCRAMVFRLYRAEGRMPTWTFSAHTVYQYPLLDPEEEFAIFSEAHPRRKALLFPFGPMSTTHIHQDLMHSGLPPLPTVTPA